MYTISSTVLLRGRHGTCGTRFALVAGVALGDIHGTCAWHVWHLATLSWLLRWQPWHLRHWVGSGVARLVPVGRPAPRRFAWQAWHLVTSTMLLCGRWQAWHLLRSQLWQRGRWANALLGKQRGTGRSVRILCDCRTSRPALNRVAWEADFDPTWEEVRWLSHTQTFSHATLPHTTLFTRNFFTHNSFTLIHNSFTTFSHTQLFLILNSFTDNCLKLSILHHLPCPYRFNHCFWLLDEVDLWGLLWRYPFFFS